MGTVQAIIGQKRSPPYYSDLPNFHFFHCAQIMSALNLVQFLTVEEEHAEMESEIQKSFMQWKECCRNVLT